MILDSEILVLLKNLIHQGGLIAIFSLIFTKIKLFRKIFTQTKTSHIDKSLIILFFSLVGIIGTYTGIPVQGALANTRVVGVFVGGLLGGPLVGIASGILAGFHRWAIDIGGFTALSCMISTIAEGVMAALLYKSFQQSKNKWLFAGLFTMTAEIMQMGIILLVARPVPNALILVETIGVPMIIGNGLAAAMFISIAESYFREREEIGARQAYKVLKIAEESLPYFRMGYNEETASHTAKIILQRLGLSAVSFTTRDLCLSHQGAAMEHHKHGEPLRTSLTKKVIAAGKTAVAGTKQEINCSHSLCPLSSAVIAPLKSGGEVIGTLKLYKNNEFAISPADVETAKGLASLFSLQIELSRLDERSLLLERAELRALQSRINPHFLFNAINTVSSFIRTKPEKARELLLDLSDYYRFRLHEPEEYIPFKKELEHVKTYLEIEMARFGDRLRFIVKGDTSVSASVPPLILQPLIENSIKHGILGRENGGAIILHLERKKGSLKITIEDDGVGICPSKLKDLLRNPGNSVGLINVHKRLINAYGSDGGLKIESKENKGTRIWMTIPLES